MELETAWVTSRSPGATLLQTLFSKLHQNKSQPYIKPNRGVHITRVDLKVVSTIQSADSVSQIAFRVVSC